MGMDKSAIEAAALRKAYEDRLNELRRISNEKTQNSLSKIKADISEHSKKYAQAYEEFVKVTDDHQRLMGTESFSTLVLQMRPVLIAFSKMSHELQMYYLSVVYEKIAANVNFQSSPGWVLEAVAEGCRLAQANIENALGMIGNDLPPVYVPYLAEVSDTGVLSVDLDTENEFFTENDRRTFVNQYQAAFQQAVERWITGSRTTAGEAMRIVNTPEGRKIQLPDGVDAEGAPVARYLTKEEFNDFRNRVLEPELARHFTVDFKQGTQLRP